MNFSRYLFLTLLIPVSVISLAAVQAEEIDAEQLSSIVKTLASDEFEGRAPGGPGDSLGG